MELANLEHAKIRLATSKDAHQIWQLFHQAMYTHSHADWHLPGDWLDTGGFVVSEAVGAARATSIFGRNSEGLLACLAVAADPPPAAWVRVTAIRRSGHTEETLAAMIDAVVPFLKESGVTELGWLAVESWPDEFLPQIGFRRVNWITTFLKEGTHVPAGIESIDSSEVTIRPVEKEDLVRLVEIETAAFAPLWRHSEEGLKLALRETVCFDVALVDEQIVGFQYSAPNQQGAGAHLVRITVHPSVQGFGVGSALMQAAFEKYRSRGMNRVSLNTQLDNIASHRLYEKFGFYRTGDQLPVWVLNIEEG
jgi:ribosomal protein S18 acetylase RimI-like enzyme